MVERSSDGGSTWTTIAQDEPYTFYVDSGLAPSTTYTYRVSAVYEGISTGQPSNTSSATTLASTYKLVVSSQLTTGGSIGGFYTTLTNSTGQLVSSGFTPVTFVLASGQQYYVAVGNYGGWVFDHWNDTGSQANPRPVSISSDTGVVAVYRDTALQLSPARAPAGTTVNATGVSPDNGVGTFAPNATVTLSWDGTVLATSPVKIMTSSTGSFSATFQVPAGASAGSHTVSATDGTNTHLAEFTISPPASVTLSSTEANVGSSVRVTGSNFEPGSPINILYDGIPYIENSTNDDTSPSETYLKADASGNFVAILAPLRSTEGTHTITVQDDLNDKVDSKITMTPHVFFFPTTAKPGATILIPASEGNGFAPNSDMTIKFDGTPILPASAIVSDSVGEFGGSFTIPSSVANGTHTVTVSDASGNTYSATIDVNTNAHSFSSQVVATGLAPACQAWSGCTDVPDSFAFIPDKGPGVDGSGAFMVNEKNSGQVVVFTNQNGTFVRQAVPFVQVPNVQVAYETNGLMGIAIDPNWANLTNTEKWVYLYVTRNETVSTAPGWEIFGEVVRYHATTDSGGNIIADPSVGEQLILKVPAFENGHNGGTLKFDSHGNLYVSTGDGWGFADAQDLTSLQGKILRITPVYSQVNGQWYSIPPSNPFASSTNPNIKKEIWAYGERNPFAFDVDYNSGKTYVSDTGYDTWESILNATAAGSNDGWPNYESPPYGNPDGLANYVSALYWYPHEGVEPQTGPAAGLEALSAGAFYHGTAYPGMDGAYFFGDYGVGFISALLPSGSAAPVVDPASGALKGQVMPVLYGLTYGPICMEEWNGKIYFMDLYGNMNVLNYN